MSAPAARCVVDTNVPVTANKVNDPSPACVLACIKALEAVTKGGHLFLDDKRIIIKEYSKNLSSKGQPGVGDAFLKWVLSRQADPRFCTQVPLTPLPEDPRDFEEFPRDEELAGFDPSDRKFVAVSCAHPERPPILQATDSKWWGLRHAFERCGVRIHFLCPKDIEEIHERKGAE